jgi:hypothetical protein
MPLLLPPLEGSGRDVLLPLLLPLLPPLDGGGGCLDVDIPLLPPPDGPPLPGCGRLPSGNLGLVETDGPHPSPVKRSMAEQPLRAGVSLLARSLPEDDLIFAFGNAVASPPGKDRLGLALSLPLTVVKPLDPAPVGESFGGVRTEVPRQLS